MRVKLGVLAFLVLLATTGLTGSATAAKGGPIDRSFGTLRGFTLANGATYPVEAGSSSFVRRDSAGSTFSLQVSTSTHMFDRRTRRLQLVKLTPDGTGDEGFGAGGYVTLPLISGDRPVAAGLALQAGSLIEVTTGSQDTDGILYLRRRDTGTGELDRSFGADGLTAIKLGSAQPDGGGWFNTVGTEVDASGRIYVSGYTSSRNLVIRLTPDGFRDKTFGTDGIAAVDDPQCPSDPVDAVLDHDSLYLATGGCVLRLTESGSLDSSYEGDQLSGTGSIVAMAKSPDGHLYLTSGDGVQIDTLWKLDLDGSFDPSFGTGGKVTIEPDGYWSNTFAVDSSGRFLFSGVDLDMTPALLRLDSTGSPDPTFGNGGVERYAFGWTRSARITVALITEGAGQPMAVGEILRNGGGYQFTIRVLDDGPLDPAWGEAGVVMTTSLIAPSDRIFDTATTASGGTLAGGKSGYKAAFVKFRPNGHVDQSYGDHGWLRFDTGRGAWDDEVRNLTLMKNGDAVACIETNPGVSIARVTSTGHLDPDFGEGGLVTVPKLFRCSGISPLPGDRFLVATVREIHGALPKTRARGVIIRFRGDGSIDGSYGSAGMAYGPISWGSPPSFGYKGTIDGGALLSASGAIVKFGPDGRRDGSFGNRGIRRFKNTKGAFRIGVPGPMAIAPDGSVLAATKLGGRVAVAKLTGKGKLVRKFGGRKGWTSIPKEEDLRVSVTDMRIEPSGKVILTAGSREKCGVFDCREKLMVYRLARSGRLDRSFAGDGIFERRFGFGSGANSVTTTPRGPVVGGWADTDAGTDDLLLIRFKK